MSSVYNVGSHSYSERQAATLCKLIKGPMALDGLSGWDRNCLDALHDRDVIDLDEETATINAAGRAVVIELNKKVNGEAKPPKRETKAPDAETKPAKPETIKARAGRRQPAEKPRKIRRDSRERPAPKSPPPTGVVDFDALRARIVEHYEADLAACDRMREIAVKVGA